MKTLGNLIWLLCGGIFTACGYLVSSIVMMITIIGIPFGFQTLKLASLAYGLLERLSWTMGVLPDASLC